MFSTRAEAVKFVPLPPFRAAASPMFHASAGPPSPLPACPLSHLATRCLLAPVLAFLCPPDEFDFFFFFFFFSPSAHVDLPIDGSTRAASRRRARPPTPRTSEHAHEKGRGGDTRKKP